MNILETQYKQRQYDDKWMKLVRVKDYDNQYSYLTDTKQKITLVPDKWLVANVYDYELTIGEKK